MGSLAISEVGHHATRFDWPTMLEAGALRSERSSNESSYRSPAPSSSHRTTSQSRNLTSTSTSARSSLSAATNNLTSATPTKSLPQRDFVSQSRDTTAQSVEPPSPRLPPSDNVHGSKTPGPPVRPVSDATSSAQPSPQTSPSTQSSSDLADTDQPIRIKVKDLQHIHSFLSDDMSSLGLSRSPSQSDTDSKSRTPQYEISGMPITDVIEMVAGLLTKITTTNDRQHEHLHRNIPSPDGAVGLSQQTSSVLAFHGKNVPSISILSYLTRIHKYCPTTYEVFISLLVYFDRMTEKVNAGPMQSLRQRQQSLDRDSAHGQASPRGDDEMSTSAHHYAQTPPSPARGNLKRSGHEVSSVQVPLSPPLSDSDPYNLSHFFVVDSFNIHRLVIAAVTCASKYFSDVFYTNSRYAKVGGLPLVELNHLEMQFLLLNDFRLAVPVEELEAYATMLVEFYAREVVAQKQGGVDGDGDGDDMEGVETSA